MAFVKKDPVKKVSSPVKQAVVQVVTKAAGMVKPAPAPAAKKISQEKMFSLIESKAYEFYVARGCVAGSDLGDWYKAEAILKPLSGNG